MSTEYEQRVVPRRQNLVVRGVNYSLVEWGPPSAPLFFYLHGWADTASTFQFVVDMLQSDWHVVAPDWRGFGHSQHALTSYWFPDYVADLHSIIGEYSADEPARLVGHSMGGNIATLYAGAIPERVSAFVNLEGFGLPNSNPDEAPARLRDWIEKSITGEKYSEYDSYETLAKKIARRAPSIKSAQADYVARQWAEQHSDGVIRLRADAKHKLPNPVLYRRAEAQACAQKITARTLSIAGGDSQFRLGEEDEALTPPGHSSVVIDDVGHMLHFEAPQLLATHIERFFKKTL